MCPVDGDALTLSSYRAELEAIRALVYFLRRLRQHDPSFAADIWLIVWIDNQQALENCMGEHKITPRTAL